MQKDKKFIIVNDKLIADKFIIRGFQLINNIGNNWTFVNSKPKNICFDDIPRDKYCYSNILSL